MLTLLLLLLVLFLLPRFIILLCKATFSLMRISVAVLRRLKP